MPWWLSVKELACQCQREPELNPNLGRWHPTEQLSPRTAATETVLDPGTAATEPMCCSCWKPAQPIGHALQQEATALRSPCTAT